MATPKLLLLLRVRPTVSYFIPPSPPDILTFDLTSTTLGSYDGCLVLLDDPDITASHVCASFQRCIGRRRVTRKLSQGMYDTYGDYVLTSH